MIKKHDKTLCEKLGLNGAAQIRVPYLYKNLHWSFDDGDTSFGYGDLDEMDLNNIFAWISNGEPGHSSLVFTGWNEHHDTEWQQTDRPMVKITKTEGITFPYSLMTFPHREDRANR